MLNEATVKMGRRKVMDLDRFIPSYLTQISNKWSRGSSRLYLKKFNIGVNEWRVMVIFAREPGITAQGACDILGSDKAAAGRSVAILEDRGLVRLEASKSDRRSRHIYLTDEGWRMHNKILAIALARERLLLDAFSQEEVDTLIGLLDRVRQNLVRLHLDTDGGA